MAPGALGMAPISCRRAEQRQRQVAMRDHCETGSRRARSDRHASTDGRPQSANWIIACRRRSSSKPSPGPASSVPRRSWRLVHAISHPGSFRRTGMPNLEGGEPLESGAASMATLQRPRSWSISCIDSLMCRAGCGSTRPDFFTISAVSLAFLTAASKERRAKSAVWTATPGVAGGVRQPGAMSVISRASPAAPRAAWRPARRRR